ncbi:hypothetical protein AB1Y20_016814 [Prymnesium parvum]|uniref:Uncharacterized protein n=1 Tax=Prymnesium parvum TaxID=97485 RepID=A0AB34I9G0_PRYPA
MAVLWAISSLMLSHRAACSPMGAAAAHHPARELAHQWPSAPPPPWMPGMAPPVPGPVFSPAFKALLVLLLIGCGVLGVNLKTSLDAMKASSLGSDNEVLTAGQPGCAAWLRDVQKSKGLRPSLAAAEVSAVDEEAGRPRRKKEGRGARRREGSERKQVKRASAMHSSDGEGCEMSDVPETEALRPKTAGGAPSRSSKAKPRPTPGID